jgi:hypothetical protein
MSAYRSPLHEMSETTPTDYWNDSCSIEEFTYGIEHGAVGATTNPVIVVDVLKSAYDDWRGRIQALIEAHPNGSEDDIAWALIDEMATKAAALLMPTFERTDGKKGRLSMQTSAKFYRNPKRDGRSGAALRDRDPQPQRQDAGHRRGHRGDRGGHVPRHQRERHGVVHGAPVAGRGRGRRARA